MFLFQTPHVKSDVPWVVRYSLKTSNAEIWTILSDSPESLQVNIPKYKEKRFPWSLHFIKNTLQGI